VILTVECVEGALTRFWKEVGTQVSMERWRKWVAGEEENLRRR
jgi:hypothetical protein